MQLLAPPTPSENQREIIEEASGRFLVRACPGSGKTYTLAARLLHELAQWRSRKSGIAALSFTNAAKDELEHQLEQFGHTEMLRYPHTLSTIDSFVNQYIFLPFAHHVCQFVGTVEMIGEPFGPFIAHGYNEFTSVQVKYDIKTGPHLKGIRGIKATQHSDILAAKARLVAQGRFTQADANYYALKILEKYPRLARSIAHRFPVIFVDEAQDSTDIQWKILHLITDQPSMRTFGVIGDPDQAIYEWNGARPELFTEYEAKLKTDGQVYYLQESRRSSQVLCDFYTPLSTLSAPPTAVSDKVKDIADAPEIWTYQDDDMEDLVSQIGKFEATIQTGESSLILCREHNLINRLHAADGSLPPGLYPWGKGTHALAQTLFMARYYYDVHNYREAVKMGERVALSIKGIRASELVFEDRSAWKKWYGGIVQLLRSLPSLDGAALGSWAAEANTILASDDTYKAIGFVVKKKGNVKGVAVDYATLPVAIFFPEQEAKKLNIQTIHKVKGHTTDKVMLILSAARAKRLAKVYQGRAKRNEDTSILYVAITRARKKVVICVPESAREEVVAVLIKPAQSAT